MPMLEISDEDAALLELAKKAGGAQGIDLAVRARTLHDKLYSHKDTATEYQRAIKKVFPDARVADDIAAPYVEKLDGVQKQLDDLIAERLKEKEDAAKTAAQRDFDANWDAAVRDHNLTEEGQEKLLKFMQDRKLNDPEAAALLYYKKNPLPPAPVAPSSVAPQGWGIGGLPGEDEASTKLLMNNPEAWADQEAAGVLTEIRRQAA